MRSPNLDLSQLPVRIEATELTCTVCAVFLEPFRAVTLVGAWSVGAVGVGVTRLLSLAFIDIWEKTCKAVAIAKTWNDYVNHNTATSSIHPETVEKSPSPRDIGLLNLHIAYSSLNNFWYSMILPKIIKSFKYTARLTFSRFVVCIYMAPKKDTFRSSGHVDFR